MQQILFAAEICIAEIFNAVEILAGKNFQQQVASNTVRKHYQGGYEFSFICDVSCVTLFIDCDINQLST